MHGWLFHVVTLDARWEGKLHHKYLDQMHNEIVIVWSPECSLVQRSFTLIKSSCTSHPPVN